MRLCVNQQGERMDAEACGDAVQEINKLTVVASESYADFVSSLQTDIKDNLYERPTKATVEYFTNQVVKVEDKIYKIDQSKAYAIFTYLSMNGYVDYEQKITDKYKADAANQELAPLPTQLKEDEPAIHKLIQSIFDENILQEMVANGKETKIEKNPLNDNFAKKEFQALWKKINHHYAYKVAFDSNIFTAEYAREAFDKAFKAKRAVQDYVFTDGTAERSVERRFAEALDVADEVVVYAKLPRTFYIPTPVGKYSPDWAIAFREGTVKHIYFIAETKGTNSGLEIKPIEKAKIECAGKLFAKLSNGEVHYGQVKDYQSLLEIVLDKNLRRTQSVYAENHSYTSLAADENHNALY